jgi:mannose-6-phosphate isomerase-like protein (cupin superfamily)
VTLTALAGKRARIALVVAVASEGETLARHIERLNKDKKAFEWKDRPRRFVSFDFAKAEDLAWGKGAYHARLGQDASAGESEEKPAMAVNLLRFSSDAPVFEHVHDKERECLGIFEGSGDLMLKPGESEMNVPVEPGTVVCIPSGMRHAWRPSGKAAFFALQVYVPPGPEQRFKLLAGKAPAKAGP